MTPADIASELLELAEQRLSSPGGHDPERFHEDRSELRRALRELALRVCPNFAGSRRATEGEGKTSAGRGGRLVIGERVVNGKRVMVQHRRPFRVHIG